MCGFVVWLFVFPSVCNLQYYRRIGFAQERSPSAPPLPKASLCHAAHLIQRWPKLLQNTILQNTALQKAVHALAMPTREGKAQINWNPHPEVEGTLMKYCFCFTPQLDVIKKFLPPKKLPLFSLEAGMPTTVERRPKARWGEKPLQATGLRCPVAGEHILCFHYEGKGLGTVYYMQIQGFTNLTRALARPVIIHFPMQNPYNLSGYPCGRSNYTFC